MTTTSKSDKLPKDDGGPTTASVEGPQTRQEALAEATTAKERLSGLGKPHVIKVEARDESDSTVDHLTRFIASQGGTVKSRSGRKYTVECPAGTNRDPSNAVSRIVQHLRSEPLVLEVEAD
jgi:hypothetical protein